MGGEAGIYRVFWPLALIGAPAPWVAVCLAGEPIGAVPNSSGPEIMFYVSEPFGATVSAPRYGLRVDRASLAPFTPGSSAAFLVRRKELMELQLGAHAGAHLDVAHRVGWDLGGRQITLGGHLPPITAYAPPRPRAPAPTLPPIVRPGIMPAAAPAPALSTLPALP
jgi:hypothetical protein